jgi:hypothetical protein
MAMMGLVSGKAAGAAGIPEIYEAAGQAGVTTSCD